MLDNAEKKVLIWRGRAAIKRHSQLLPSFGERPYIVRRSRRDYLILWRKYHGLQVLASRMVTVPANPRSWVYYNEDWYMPIKRRFSDPSSLVMPDLPSNSKIFAKFPTLMAFLTARSYEEGGARLPGKYWFDGSSAGFQLTLIDVDQGYRLVVRAQSIDDVYTAAELALGADNAPWEPDQYQQEKLAKNRKKK